MLLTQFSMDACTGFEQAESDWLAALSGALDNSTPGQNLLVSATTGFDAEILDAIMATPNPDMCPLARLTIAQENETLAMGGLPVFAQFTMQLYLFYYFGVPATDPTFTSFVMLRRQHVGMIMRAIQLQLSGVSKGITNSNKYWKWDSSRPRAIDFVSPFKYLDRSYMPDSQYNCVRLDCPVLIKTAQ